MTEKQVDDRVVEMRFDNSQFESAVKQSMGTLDNLNNSIKKNTSGNVDNFKALNKAINSVDTSGLSKGVETVTAKFSALNVAGMTVISNLTTAVMNFATQAVKKLTVQPLIDGLHEYETQINAIQTIMSNTKSKGTTLDQVNGALDELNHYADLTIYNFSEMTKNIGTFTAAGVDLQTSVDSIKGIANLAAVSGSTSQQASVAMYQLSQAIATGTVRLQDWNSVVNAGMGGEVFQNALKRTAEHFGTDVDSMISKYGSFRESLTRGDWLTTQVLTETLKQISGAYSEADLIAQGYSQDQAQAIADLADDATKAATKIKTGTQLISTMWEAIGSGWTKTWQLIVGDFEESRAFWSGLWNDELSPIIEGFSNARNDLLEEALGGNYSKLTAQLKDAGVPIDDLESKIKDLARENGIAIDDMIDQYGSLSGVFDTGALSGDLVTEALKQIGDSAAQASDQTEDLNAKLEYFQEVVDAVWYGTYKNGQERVEALTAAGYNYAEVQDLVNKTVDGHRLTLEDLNIEQMKSIGYTDEQIATFQDLAKQAEETGTPINELISSLNKPSGRQLLIQTVYNIITALKRPVQALGTAFKNTFSIKGSFLYNFLEGLEKLTSKFVLSEENADKLRRTFQGLFSVLKFVGNFVGEVLNRVFGSFNDVLGDVFDGIDFNILDVTASWGDMLTEMFGSMDASEAVDNAFDGIGKALEIVGDLISQFIDYLKQLPYVGEFVTAIGDRINVVSEYAKSFDGLTFNEGIVKLFEDIKTSLDSIDWEAVKKAISDFASEAGESLKTFAEDAIQNLKDFWDQVTEYIKTFDGLTFGESVNKLFGDLKSAIANGAVDLSSWASGEMASIGPYMMQGLQNGLENSQIDVIAILRAIGEQIVQAFKDVLGIHSPSTVFFEIGQNIIQGLLNGLMDTSGAVTDWFTRFKDTISGIFENVDWGSVTILGFAGSMIVVAHELSKATKGLSSSIEKIGGGWLSIGSGINDFLKALTSRIKGTKFGLYADGILKIAGAVAILVGAIILLSKQDLDKAWEATGMVAAIVGVLTGAMIALMAMSKVANNIDVTGVAAVLVGFGAGALLMAIALNKLKDITPSQLESALEVIGLYAACIGAFMLIAKIPGADTGIEAAGSLALKLGISMLLLAQAINMISDIDESQLDKALTIIGIYGLILTGMALLSAFTGKNAKKIGEMALGLSASFVLLAVAMRMLGDLSDSQLMQSAKVIIAFGIIVAALVAVSAIGEKSVKTAGKFIMEVAASFILLAVAAKLMGGMSDKELEQAAGAMAIFVVVVGGLLLISRLGSEAKNVAKNILAIAAAIALISFCTYLLGNVKTENLIKGVAAIGTLMLMLALVFKVASGIQPGTDKSFVAIAVSLGILVAGIAILSFIDPSALLTSVVALVVVMGMLALIFKIANNFQTDLKSVLVIVAALGILIAGLVLLAQAPLPNILASALALGLVMAEFAIILKTLSSWEGLSEKALWSVIAIGGVFALLGAVLVALAGQDFLGILAATVSLIAVMSAFNMILYSLGEFKGLSDRALASVIVLGSVFIGLGIVLATLAKLDPASVLVSAASMIALIVTMTLVLKELSNIKSVSASALIGLAAVGLIMAGIGTIVGLMEKYDVAPSLETALALSALLLSMTVSFGILATVGPLAEMAIPALLSMLKVVGILGLVFTAFGMLVSDAGPIVDAINMIGDVLEAIGNAVGRLIGGLVGGVMEGIADTLPDIGLKLSMFMMNLMPFILGLKMIDDSSLAAVQTISDMFIKLTEASLINGITSFLGLGDFSALGSKLVEFGSAMSDYAAAVAGVDFAKVSESAQAGQALTDLYNSLPKEGGWMQKIFGETTDMGEFAEDLVEFGDAMAKYSASISEVSFDKISESAKAGQALSDLAGTLPKEGGLAQAIFGEITDMGTFGDQLKTFGEGISNYGASVENLNVEAIQNSATAGQALSDLASALPKEGGLGAAIFGSETNIDEFGAQIKAFGSALLIYSLYVSTINIDAIQKSVHAGEALSELAKNLPDSGAFGPDTSRMENLGANMKVLGTALSDFSSSLGGLDIEDIYSKSLRAKAIVTNVADASAIDLSGVSNLSSLKDVGTSLSEFGSSMGVIDFIKIDANVNKIKEISSTLSTIQPVDTTGIDSLKSAVNSLKSIDFASIATKSLDPSKFKYAGTNAMNSMAAGIRSGSSIVTSAIRSIFTSMSNSAKTFANQMRPAGMLSITNLAAGISSGSGKVKTAVATALSSGLSAVSSYTGRFRSAGYNLSAGLANGIASGQYLVSIKARAVAQAAVRAAEKALDEHSPSKVFYRIGKFAYLGLANALNDNIGNSYKSGYSIANSAIDGLGDAMAKISDYSDSLAIDEMDPVVKPVVDLSNIERGAEDINNMLGRTIPSDVLSTVNGINRGVNLGLQNSSNDDVVSAIDSLRKTLMSAPRGGDTIIGDISYSGDSDINNAIRDLVRAIRVEERV